METNGRETVRRNRCVFRGIIQGVGFRPFVYRCATAFRLTGYVQNRRSEVLAEVEGSGEDLEGFLERLRSDLPAPARLEALEVVEIPPRGGSSFSIRESETSSYTYPPIPPDLALCPECAAELLDPTNRRFLYPFITCTQCGPRYSITVDTPFDRQSTSMAGFLQCPDCLAEYRDPADRRFHSQTNSCPTCGPTLRLVTPEGGGVPGDPLIEAIRALGQGRVVALQGIGGFHLAADPGHPGAVDRLRHDKERQRKPFALMAADRQEALRLCRIEPEDLELLASSESPILISPMCEGLGDDLHRVSDTNTLGIMLPYTPLHLLLFRHPKADIPYRLLIMTSGNRMGEPILTDPAQAASRLGGVAELFLIHDRPILNRLDDSILRRGRSSGSYYLRRSRGAVPRPVSFKSPLPRNILAVGADLKSAPGLGIGGDAHLAPYLGDLENPLVFKSFEEQIRRLLSLYGLKPETVVYDLHPGYRSTRWALAFPAERHQAVQHHHAHLLSVMAEHGLEEVIGLAFDGTGYGPDETVWGGEFMHASRGGFKRLGCFRPFPLPGGEAAIRKPIRFAVSLCSTVLSPGEMELSFTGRQGLPAGELTTLLGMIEKGVRSPLTSSLGRLFDAAAALLGLVEETEYEGEGPIRLEGFALQAFNGEELEGNSVSLEELVALSPPAADGNPFHLDPRPLMRLLALETSPGRESRLGLLFHKAVAQGALKGARRMREATGIKDIALSGGVFQNLLLRELLVPALVRDGFSVFLNRRVSPGDEGIALGQLFFQA